MALTEWSVKCQEQDGIVITRCSGEDVCEWTPYNGHWVWGSHVLF